MRPVTQTPPGSVPAAGSGARHDPANRGQASLGLELDSLMARMGWAAADRRHSGTAPDCALG